LEDLAMAEEPANVNVTSALPDDVRESVAAANFKVVGDSPAVLQNLALANAVAHQQAMNQISQAATGKIVESIISTQPAEGRCRHRSVDAAHQSCADYASAHGVRQTVANLASQSGQGGRLSCRPPFFGGKTMGKRNTATSARQLSAKINEIRKRQGISPFALSKKTGLKPDTVKRVLGIGPEGRKNAGKANLGDRFSRFGRPWIRIADR
jgi:hypothetical protein